MPHKTSRRTKPEPKPRKLKQPQYKSFRLHKSIKHPAGVLPSAWSITKSSFKHIVRHKKLFLGLGLVYLLLTIVLVQGFAVNGDLSTTKESVQEAYQGATGQLAGSLAVLGVLVSSGSSNGEAASVYQSFIIVVMSLAFIWALRQTHAGQQVSVKDAMYKSMYPLVQFILVLLMIGLQMLPFIAGNFLYASTVGGGLAVGGLEVLLWSLLAFLLVLWSFYMVTASVFALYIVTLPDMMPRQALRSAKNLVQFRRWTVMRKVLFLPLIVLVVGAVIMLPIIMFVTPLAEVVFLILGALVIAFAHSYVYTLYRELL